MGRIARGVCWRRVSLGHKIRTKKLAGPDHWGAWRQVKESEVCCKFSRKALKNYKPDSDILRV